jgi:hypothetical protein
MLEKGSKSIVLFIKMKDFLQKIPGNGFKRPDIPINNI